MEAIPGALVIEREEKEVRRLQGIEPRTRIAPLGHVIAQVRAHAREDRSVQQKPHRRLIQARQNLRIEKPGDGAIHPGEALDDRGRRLAAFDSDGSELQAGDPALGALVQPGGE